MAGSGDTAWAGAGALHSEDITIMERLAPSQPAADSRPQPDHAMRRCRLQRCLAQRFRPHLPTSLLP